MVQVEVYIDKNGIVGTSPQIQHVRKLIEKVALSDYPVAISGQSGTGKELVAKAVHYNSKRAKFPFISVNCAAVPEGLKQAAFFGSTRGAYTGAINDEPGYFGRAQYGTLFLDEVQAAQSIQELLLRVLQEKVYDRVGQPGEPIKADIRLIVASSK